MNVKLIDIDSTIPNLALMQLSAYHTQLGDDVGFDTPEPDLVYISCIFKKNASTARGVASYFPDSKIIIGGSGVDLKSAIPDGAQKIYPDYDLYPMDYDLGFTTRGCIRKCPFCVVPEKEGRLHHWMDIEEFHDPSHKVVHLLDNNLTASHDDFFKQTDFCIKNNLKLRVLPGMDIRLMTPEIAEQINRVKWDGTINFAWDNMKDEVKVKAGIEMLREAGVNLRPKVVFYVLTTFNTTHEEDLYRCNTLKDLGVSSFVMQFKPNKQSKRLARWANRRWLYWSIPFDEYNG